VRPALAAAEFEGKVGQVAVLPVPDNGARRVVFVGLGDDVDTERLRQAAGTGRKAVPTADSIATTLHKVPLDGAVGAVLDGFGLADYRFETYKSAAKTRPELSIELIGADKGWEEEADRSAAVVRSVLLARDLVNEPSINKPPMALSERIAAVASEVGVGVEIWDIDRLRDERMGGIIGVGQGSSRPPCLLQLHYKPRRPKAKLALVGKGIVFDTGGISIKPAERMEEMKGDMAGAAAACAAVIAIAALGLPIEVRGYGAFAENMPGGSAQRPGDVLTTRNGKTIEVLNTDAEGRLVLADAIALAAEWEPDLIVDLATLTGAIVVALGPKIAGVFGNDEASIEKVIAAAGSAGERMWPMPLPDDYRSMIDSDVADMKNTGQGRYGGAITAAMLLREYPGEAPWVHIDIAGPAYGSTAEHYIPKAGTGFGVRTLVELAGSMV
jgi:leucyl aminopeptidase